MVSSNIYIGSIGKLDDILLDHVNQPEIRRAASALKLEILKEWVKEEEQFADLKHGLNRQEWQQLEGKQKIQAIKLFRERNSVGLKEAKEAVENAMQREYGYTVFPY